MQILMLTDPATWDLPALVMWLQHVAFVNRSTSDWADAIDALRATAPQDVAAELFVLDDAGAAALLVRYRFTPHAIQVCVM